MVKTDHLSGLISNAYGGRRADLQGMRAVAVLMVFANHLFGWPPGGFVGVDVFFVLSGFFITGLLIRERETTSKLSFRRFYTRRVKRILPSALLVLVLTVLGANLLFPAGRARDTLLDALYAAVFAANFRFESIGADYFQQDQPPSPIQHYWSLSIEEQFYFVWPALLAIVFALTRRYKKRGKMWPRHWALFGSMSIVVAGSFAWAMHLSVEDPNRAYFSSFTRVWELGVGALVAIAGVWLVRIPTAARPVLAYLGVAGVVGSLFLVDETVQFPAPWAGLPVISTALVVASFHGCEVRGMFPLTNPIARWFGDTSYTLYLWHWPVIILLQTILPEEPLFYSAAIAISLSLTAITYHFYENPIRTSDWLLDVPVQAGWKMPKVKPAAWGLAGALAAVMVITSILGISYSDRNASAREEIADAQAEEVGSVAQTEIAADPCFGAPAMVTPGCALRNPDVPLTPSVDDFANDEPRGVTKCFTLKDAKLRSCTFGYGGDDGKRIALVGDSHAAFLLPALKPLLEANKWQITTFIGTPCALSDPAPDGCVESMDKAKAALMEDPYDLVLVANRNNQQDAVGYQRAWAPIVSAGSRFAVVQDNPETSEEAISCLTRVGASGDRNGECGVPQSWAFRHADPLVAAADLTPGTEVIDLSRYYCKDGRCPSVIGNVIVYYDTTHITATFAKTLAEPLEDGLRRALAR